MIYYADEMELFVVQKILVGEVNDIYVCKDLNSTTSELYTLICIKNKEISKKMLYMFSDTNKNGYKKCFTKNDSLCYVFDYARERRLYDFYKPELENAEGMEQICLNFITEIISMNIPYPLIYLILTQRLFNLGIDKKVYFSYYFDLSDIDFKIEEDDCAAEFANILLYIIDEKKMNNTHAVIQKKSDRNIYISFIDIYRDLKLSIGSNVNINLFSKLKANIIARKDRILKLALVICILVGIASSIAVFTQVLNIETFKVFSKDFDVIGTEVLNPK